jgi:hypothetical protein
MLAWKQPSFKESVTAHQSSESAPIISGTKLDTEAMDSSFPREGCLVGERSMVGRRYAARRAGRNGSDDAGMSSDKTGEKPVHRKP